MATSDKWTLVLSRIPRHEESTVEGMQLDERMYELTGVLLNGEELRVKKATVVMVTRSLATLHLEVVLRNLEIVMEEKPNGKGYSGAAQED